MIRQREDGILDISTELDPASDSDLDGTAVGSAVETIPRFGPTLMIDGSASSSSVTETSSGRTVSVDAVGPSG
jgi:hypothetical protein